MTSLKDEQRCIVAYLDSVQARLASHKGMISLREPHKGVILQSATGDELDALLPSAEGATIGMGV
jgi:hypothetical protein